MILTEMVIVKGKKLEVYFDVEVIQSTEYYGTDYDLLISEITVYSNRKEIDVIPSKKLYSIIEYKLNNDMSLLKKVEEYRDSYVKN